jgi:HK97 family phage portal protein
VGLWGRLKLALRALANPADAFFYPRSFGIMSATGEPVSVERAVSLSAVWSCVTLIAGAIASMPLILYRREPDETRTRYVDHPLYDVLHTRPNPVQPVVAFWESMVTALLLRGNAFALITRDDDGRVRALWYVNPDRVSVELLRNARLRYRVSTPDGQQQTLRDGEMLHVTGPMSSDGYLGRSVIATFRETLGLGLALERYGAEFFANAATPRGILKTAGRLTDPARTRLGESLKEQHTGPGQRHRTLVLEEGLEFQPIAVSHEDAQFLELRRFGVEEIARIFRVPIHLVSGNVGGNSRTYANAETSALDFLKFCLGPWLARIESAVNFACVPPQERRQQYAEFLPDALLMTDTAGRYAAYKTGLEAGFLTIDEVRRKENLPALSERAPAVG